MMHLPLWQRLVSGYVMVDLTYVFFTRRFPVPGKTPEERLSQQAYMMGNCAINYLAWMGASLVGIALSNVIPTAWGLGFAGILALVGVLASMANSGLRVVSVGVSGAAAVAAWALPLKLNIVVAIASAVAVCLVIEAVRAPRDPSGAQRV
jgi:predicted branched-subunit amino acid permease